MSMVVALNNGKLVVYQTGSVGTGGTGGTVDIGSVAQSPATSQGVTGLLNNDLGK
jgi:hypothetical protein